METDILTNELALILPTFPKLDRQREVLLCLL